MNLKYFTNRDFQSATPTCDLSDMDENFMHRLDTARGLAGIPFIVNSAYRTESYEKSKGRDGTSEHTEGLAVDLKAEGSRQRFLIIDALLKAGFNRIGIGEDFIHVGFSQEKDRNVIWHYYE
jgi:uncharacterized protein YcbK (DUF882 family)